MFDSTQTTADAAELLTEWSALADRLAAPPFLHPGWIAAWTNAFGVESLRLIAVHRDGELVAAMPMDKRGGNLHAPANCHSPLFGPLAIDNDARDELLLRLFDDRCTSIELNVLGDNGGGTGDALRPIADTARDKGMLILSRTPRSPAGQRNAAGCGWRSSDSTAVRSPATSRSSTRVPGTRSKPATTSSCERSGRARCCSASSSSTATRVA